MSLPRPPERNESRWATEVTRQLEQQYSMSHKRGTDVELGTGERVIMRSPNGNRWAITVDDSGTITTTQL